jgi:hypothetical protein
MKRFFFWVVLASVCFGSNMSARANLIVFSSSTNYRTPETISQAPFGFGPFQGDYFIPDENRAALGGNIWVVPLQGGPPTSFVTNPDYVAFGGLFLPATGWGAASNNLLITGGGGNNGLIFTYAFNGTRTSFASVPVAQFNQPQIAPAGFGTFAGQLVVPEAISGKLYAFMPNGQSNIVGTVPFFPFGLGFSPSGFGNLSNDAFVTSSSENKIAVVKPDGTESPFATIPLLPGQTGLRQIAFSPSGFVSGFGPLLLVSVSGSTNGGGTLGNVYALDSNGNIVASLRSDLGLTKFDPRGMAFTPTGNLLINDASDAAVYQVQASDFVPIVVIPEPASVVLLVIGLLGVIIARQRRHARRRVPCQLVGTVAV